MPSFQRPLLVAALFAAHAAGQGNQTGGYVDDIINYVDGIAEQLWPINTEIHSNPQVRFEETIAHAALTEYLATQEGWEVTPSAFGLETAFLAVHDSGVEGPVISFNAEYDALPEIGHACGHNLIASASVAGALAAADIAKRNGLAGKIVLIGTPGEEGGGGKIKLIEAGAYNNVSVSLISHPSTAADSALMKTNANYRFTAEYVGLEAHAAASPWLGINALDALTLAHDAFSKLRQQIKPGEIIQGYITHGGTAENIIPAYSAGKFAVRAASKSELEALKVRVGKCFEAGSLATGANLTLTPGVSYLDHSPNLALGRAYRSHFNSLGGSIADEAQDIENGKTSASTDQGDVSYLVPSLSAAFHIQPGVNGGGPHSPDFTNSTGTRESFDAALRVGKGLAAVAIDLLTNATLLEEVQAEFATRA